MQQTTSKSDATFCWFIFTLALLGYSYFYNGGSWNQNARYDSIFAFVEPGTKDTGTFRINRFLPNPAAGINTGDWTVGNKGYYSNKAPGVSLLGVPVYAVIYQFEILFGLDPASRVVAILNGYLINLFVTVLPLCLSLVAFYLILQKLHLSQENCLSLTLVLGFSTMFFPYSSSLWGHGTAAAFLILSLYRTFGSSRSEIFFSGFLGGMAVLCDFLSVLPLLVNLSFVITRHRFRAWPFFCGGAVTLAILFVYNFICFGSPISLPTDNTNPEFISKDNWLGLFGALNLEALYKLTFHFERGLFVSSPILLLSLVGFVYGLKTKHRDVIVVSSVISSIGSLLLNASFNGWHGGATVGPRYLIVALPYLVLALRHLPKSNLFEVSKRVLAAVSALLMLAVNSISPIAPDIQTAQGVVQSPNPFGLWVIPNFLSGNFAAYKFPIRLQALDPAYQSLMKYTTWNLGQLLGLSGVPSLFPLLSLLLLALFYWRALFSGITGQLALRLGVVGLVAISILDNNRLIELARKWSLQGEVLALSSEQRFRHIARAFPFVGEVYRVKRELEANRIGQIALVSGGNNAEISSEVTQRLSELLYPIAIIQDSSNVLKVTESQTELKLEVSKR